MCWMVAVSRKAKNTQRNAHSCSGAHEILLLFHAASISRINFLVISHYTHPLEQHSPPLHILPDPQDNWTVSTAYLHVTRNHAIYAT